MTSTNGASETAPRFAIELWQSYVGRGAPSNASGSRSGIGRTKAEATSAAGHWANQASWERHRKIVVVDGDDKHTDAVWRLVGISEYLPPTAEGREIEELLRSGRYASALSRYFTAIDAGVDLFEN